MTTTAAQLTSRRTEKDEGRAPRQETAALKQDGKSYSSSVARDVDALQAEIDALPSLDELYERAADVEHRLDALKQELDAMAQEPMPWETSAGVA